MIRDLVPAFVVGAAFGIVALLLALAAQATPRLTLACVVFVIVCAVLTALVQPARPRR